MSGIKMTDVGEFDALKPVVDRLHELARRVGAPDVYAEIPETFYGSLDELVNDGYLVAPRQDDKGNFVPTTTGQVLRNRDGDVVFLYIPDSSNVPRDEKKRNRIHMYWCGHLTQALNEKRQDRYCGTVDVSDSGYFCMENDAVVRMLPCKNCYDYARRYRDCDYGTIDKFKYKKFATENSLEAKRKGIKSTVGNGVDATPIYGCANCDFTTTDPDELDPKYLFCPTCFAMEQIFLPLRSARTLDDLSDWFTNTGTKDLRYGNGQTPLMYLVRHNSRPKLIKAMVETYGCDVNATDNDNKSVLMHFVESNNLRPYSDLSDELDTLRSLGANVKHEHRVPDKMLGHANKMAVGYAGENTELRHAMLAWAGMSTADNRRRVSYSVDRSGFRSRDDDD